MKRFLTGVKPTGFAHLGNYFGAIKPAIELSKQKDSECLYFIADYHALTTVETGAKMEEYFYNIACTWLACGLDPEKVIFYRQSDIKEDFELNWILCNVTPKGLMNRAHAYKAMVEKNSENGVDKDDGVNMGLYNYPILMTADIVLFDTDFVPVGFDQKQHVEIARDIVHNFNLKYGKALKEPNEYIDKNCATLVGLDGRKMSKSYNNTIRLFGTSAELKKSIMRIVTDSRLPGEPKDKDCTVNKLFKLFASADEAEKFENDLLAGLGWGEAKNRLFEVADRYISPMREKYNHYMAHKDEVDKILADGAVKARSIASKVLSRVREAIGVK